MDVTTYNSEKEFTQSVGEIVRSFIQSSIEQHGDARILLSGGSTPGPVYEWLSHTDLDWNKVQVGLVDERFVPLENEYSNERLLLETLVRHQAKNAKLAGMVYDTEDRNENLEIAKNRYAQFIERTDLVLLGMGGDGHTASLFPGDETSENDLNESTIGLINTQAPSHPQNRISCSKALILKAEKIMLLIKGNAKLEVLQNKDLQLPIHTLIADRSAIETYYTES